MCYTRGTTQRHSDGLYKIRIQNRLNEIKRLKTGRSYSMRYNTLIIASCSCNYFPPSFLRVLVHILCNITNYANAPVLALQGYKLQRQYVREMAHLLDGQRVFDPKMPLEHDATTFTKNAEMTSTILGEMVSDAHVSPDELQQLSLLSGLRKTR